MIDFGETLKLYDDNFIEVEEFVILSNDEFYQESKKTNKTRFLERNKYDPKTSTYETDIVGKDGKKVRIPLEISPTSGNMLAYDENGNPSKIVINRKYAKSKNWNSQSLLKHEEGHLEQRMHPKKHDHDMLNAHDFHYQKLKERNMSPDEKLIHGRPEEELDADVYAGRHVSKRSIVKTLNRELKQCNMYQKQFENALKQFKQNPNRIPNNDYCGFFEDMIDRANNLNRLIGKYNKAIQDLSKLPKNATGRYDHPTWGNIELDDYGVQELIDDAKSSVNSMRNTLKTCSPNSQEFKNKFKDTMHYVEKIAEKNRQELKLRIEFVNRYIQEYYTGDDNMIDFGDLLYQESAKKSKDKKAEKYDDKYDLDNDQGTTIEPADVDVDDDFDYGSSEEEESDDEKKEEKKKSKKKKKSSKKKDVDEEEDGTEEEPSEEEADDDNADRDDEIDVEEEGFKEGIKAELKSIPEDFKKGFNRYKDYYKQMGQDIKDNIQDIKDDGLKGLLNANVNASVRRQDRLDDFNMRGIQDRKDSRHEILDAYKSKNKVDKFARDAKRNIGRGIRKAGEKIDDTLTESYRYQEAAELIKNHLKQDIDEEQESRVGENNYYTFIANSSKDLEHLYKTLMKRGSKEMIMEEMNNIFNELKERREKYFSSRKDEHSSDPKRSYQGLKRIIDQDIENIEKNIEQLSDPEQPKMNKSLMKKTIKMINNLQQDMITECQRSQPTIIRYARDVAKKLWLFEYNIEETDTEVTMESGEDAMLAKVGEMLVHLRKQKELQDLAEKSGVQINGMRYTDDTIMNIVTSMVSLMLAKEEGDPRYARLVDQGMQKRSLKVEIINAYKDKANDLINRYDHGPIVTAEPYNRDIEVISDEDQDVEEFYIDEYGEMHSSYYQEADDEDTKDPFYKLEQEIGKKLPSIYRKLIPTTLDPKEHVQEMAERFYDQKLKTNNKEYSEYTFGELYTVEDVLKHYGDHEGYLSFDEGDGFGNYALIKIDDWSVYLYIHDAPDGNKYVKIANSLNNLCHKLNISTDKVIDEYYQYYYQESDEDDDEDDEDDIEDEDSDEEDNQDDEDIDDEDSDEDDDDEDDDKEKENDDDDDATEDDKELKDKDDVEEFYIDETGRMRSTWYNEMDETYDGPGGVSNSQRTKFKDTDEQIEWEVKPCKEVEDIEFGDERKKVLKKLTKDFGEPQHRDEEKDDYGKFIVYYENDKVSRVTILKDIQIELDRSIVFPGNADNIRKKALDLKPVGDGKLVSRVMSIEVKLNSDNTLESITFARRQYYTDQQYQKYDSVKWHIENGKTEKDAIKFFKEIYKFFEKHSLLTPDGREEMRSIGINSVLNTNELTERGNQFVKIYYDRNRNCDYKTIRNTLEQCWTQFTSQTYTKGEKDSN